MGKSARIKRRNKCGFKGVGNHKTLKAVFGTPKMFDYSLDNAAHITQVKQAKINGFKHPGSKTGKQLLNITKRRLTALTHNALNYLKGVF